MSGDWLVVSKTFFVLSHTTDLLFVIDFDLIDLFVLWLLWEPYSHFDYRSLVRGESKVVEVSRENLLFQVTPRFWVNRDFLGPFLVDLLALCTGLNVSR